MSVKIRERVYPETNTVTWQADIHVKLIDGRKIRERSKIPGATSRAAALKWARERERWLILHGHEKEEEEVEAAPKMPTLAEFSERFVVEYLLANRLKPSTIHNRKKYIRIYLIPNLGDRLLDQIDEVDVQRLKAKYAHLKISSVNAILEVLGAMLRMAVEWGVLPAMPKIRKLKRQDQRFAFYDEVTYQRLVKAAGEVDERCLLAVLLGGDAGLRGGEIAGLRLVHCDVERGVLHIVENDWCGHVGLPKGNRPRQVVMTSRLRELLRELKRRSDDVEARVLARSRGEGTPTSRVIVGLVTKAQKAAGLPLTGTHILRHTFCSRLAARGATPKAIQELAGHASSSTTDRYMHLAPGALRTAIALIEG
ncbi:MAG: site-specific integrase [Nannocystis sp.]|nr:site-specific integrase [Nannocystis sp.]